LNYESHDARLLGTGTWVQAELTGGAKLRGRVTAGRFDEFHFGTREVVELEPDGQPFTWCGRIPPASQIVEVALETRAPQEIADLLKTFVERLDTVSGRKIIVVRDDALVAWCQDHAIRILRVRNAVIGWFQRWAHVVPTI